MIEVSSFLTNKSLCNIFADKIVKKISEVTPNAKTQITVLNVRSFFIVRGYTSSEVVVNVSDILSEIYEKYESELVKTVRVVDTILYNKTTDEKLKVSHKENRVTNKVINELEKTCNLLQKEGFYISIKVDGDNLYYDFEHEVDFDPTYINHKFENYNCIKDDFSNEIYVSDAIYGLSNDSYKYYHIILRKISYNLLNRGFTSDVCLNINSNLDLKNINSDNINLSIGNSGIIKKETLESLILDNFNFDLDSLSNEFDLSSFGYNVGDETTIWENYRGTKDFIFL